MIFNKTLFIASAVALVYSETALAQAAAPAPAPAVATTQTFAIPNAKIAWKNEYPSGATKPIAKPEWLALVKDDAAMKITPNILTVGKIIF
jgi:hypothetical protein